MEEQDSTKRKKVSILVTGRKNIYKKQTELHVSLLLAGGRRRIQKNTEPGAYEEHGRKIGEEKKTGDLLSFSPCTIFKTRSCPHNLNATLSFLALCSETARKRLLRG